MSETRATPLYCPYCAGEDLRPHAHEQEHGAWECRSCARVFAVRLIGLLALGVSRDATAATAPTTEVP